MDKFPTSLVVRTASIAARTVSS